jgi:Zn-dependent protease
MFGDFTLTDIIVLIVAILISMAIHEASHAYVGLKLGDDTAAEAGRISLNPLRHIDPFATVLLPIITLIVFHAPILAAKPVPFNPTRVKFDEFGAAMIAFAGPLSNLLLAIIAAFIGHSLPIDSFAFSAISTFIILNVSLFVFNLVPIPPLDGSRVLYAFAPEPVQRFFEQIEPIGLFIIFGLILFGGFSNLLVDIIQSVLQLLP